MSFLVAFPYIFAALAWIGLAMYQPDGLLVAILVDATLAFIVVEIVARSRVAQRVVATGLLCGVAGLLFQGVTPPGIP